MAIFSAIASATIINIPTDYATIQAGINASSDGDTVLVQPETYMEGINFYGRNIAVGSLFLTTGNENYIERTIIDADSWGSVVIFESYEDSTASISGFTITNGLSAAGGGIFCTNSSPRIDNNDIIDNVAMTAGGGIYCWESGPIIFKNLIANNVADNDWDEGTGGGINCIYNSTPVINNNVITGNRTRWAGGGIYCGRQTTAIIDNNTVEGNFVGGRMAVCEGGGIYGAYSTMVITNNLIRNNFADATAFSVGGGILIDICDCQIIGNTVEFNTVNSSGGGMLVRNSQNALISGNMIKGNNAGWGGGLACNQNTMIANNVITGNVADSIGGGIVCMISNSMKVINNTIYGNSALYGGGIYFWQSGPFVLNCILRADTASMWGNEIECDENSNPTFSYCNIQGGWPGEGNIDIDPLFRDPDIGDYHLMAIECGDPYDSRCIDMGHPDILDSLLDCDWGLGCLRSDMGAYGGGDSVGVNIDDLIKQLPKRIALSQNYPNPFNASTVIKYELSQQSQVTINIYNILGRKVSTLIDKQQPAGYHQAIWRTDDFSSGMYFYMLQAGDYIETKKMLLLR